jgi:thiamine-phosphate pyrophosphorylase
MTRGAVVLPRLYAILDTDALGDRGLEPEAVFDAWLEAGVRLIQLRAKGCSSGALLKLADSLSARARRAGALFIVNDRADVAALAGASGVHIGGDDLGARDVRRILPAGALVGRSSHSRREVLAALGEPVDYLAIGAVYPTARKPSGHPVVGLEGVTMAAALARRAGRPLVAIGGITCDRAPAVLGAGAAAVAVISDLLVGDPAARAREWLEVVR